MALDEATLRESFPIIDWDKPQRIHLMSGQGGTDYACAYCIAMYGVKGPLSTDPSPTLIPLSRMPRTAEEFAAHLKQEHGIEI